jgi:hypothetical protein
MTHCEVIEVRNLADADGIPCPKTASKQCSDCGIELCDYTLKPVSCAVMCFAPSCVYFHQREHPKAARGERRARKSA